MTTCAATRHGDRKAYRLGCRCPEALEDRARYERHRKTEQILGRPRLLDATGTRRRLQALMANGWSSDELGARIGYTDGFGIRKLCRNPFVQRSTADRVKRLYDDLADLPGPSGRVRRWAAAQGFLVPLWWDEDTIDDPAYVPALEDGPRQRDDVDPVVVDRLVDGTHAGRATAAERFAAFLRLRDGGHSGKFIFERLRLSWATFADFERRADAASISEGAAA